MLKRYKVSKGMFIVTIVLTCRCFLIGQFVLYTAMYIHVLDQEVCFGFCIQLTGFCNKKIIS